MRVVSKTWQNSVAMSFGTTRSRVIADTVVLKDNVSRREKGSVSKRRAARLQLEEGQHELLKSGGKKWAHASSVHRTRIPKAVAIILIATVSLLPPRPWYNIIAGRSHLALILYIVLYCDHTLRCNHQHRIRRQIILHIDCQIMYGQWSSHEQWNMSRLRVSGVISRSHLVYIYYSTALEYITKTLS
jgi:hypothetical protein